MRVMVFLHGTLITHKNSAGKTREEIIQQIIEQEESVRDFENYIPIGNAPKKLQAWVSQGAEMTYPSLSPELKAKIKSIIVKKFEDIDNLPDDLNLYNFL